MHVRFQVVELTPCLAGDQSAGSINSPPVRCPIPPATGDAKARKSVGGEGGHDPLSIAQIAPSDSAPSRARRCRGRALEAASRNPRTGFAGRLLPCRPGILKTGKVAARTPDKTPMRRLRSGSGKCARARCCGFLPEPLRATQPATGNRNVRAIADMCRRKATAHALNKHCLAGIVMIRREEGDDSIPVRLNDSSKATHKRSPPACRGWTAARSSTAMALRPARSRKIARDGE